MKNEKKQPAEWTVTLGKKTKTFETFDALKYADSSEIKGTRAVDFTNQRIIVIPTVNREKRDIA
jgi:hypothetical protein